MLLLLESDEIAVGRTRTICVTAKYWKTQEKEKDFSQVATISSNLTLNGESARFLSPSSNLIQA